MHDGNKAPATNTSPRMSEAVTVLLSSSLRLTGVAPLSKLCLEPKNKKSGRSSNAGRRAQIRVRMITKSRIVGGRNRPRRGSAERGTSCMGHLVTGGTRRAGNKHTRSRKSTRGKPGSKVLLILELKSGCVCLSPGQSTGHSVSAGGKKVKAASSRTQPTPRGCRPPAAEGQALRGRPGGCSTTAGLGVQADGLKGRTGHRGPRLDGVG